MADCEHIQSHTYRFCFVHRVNKTLEKYHNCCYNAQGSNNAFGSEPQVYLDSSFCNCFVHALKISNFFTKIGYTILIASAVSIDLETQEAVALIVLEDLICPLLRGRHDSSCICKKKTTNCILFLLFVFSGTAFHFLIFCCRKN